MTADLKRRTDVLRLVAEFHQRKAQLQVHENITARTDVGRVRLAQGKAVQHAMSMVLGALGGEVTPSALGVDQSSPEAREILLVVSEPSGDCPCGMAREFCSEHGSGPAAVEAAI
jgi:hypothetical protein